MGSLFKSISGECSLVIGHGFYRSQNERRGSPHWLFEPDVLSFVYQQPVVYYRYRGKFRRYTGDTLVRFRSGRRPLVVEYKLAQAFEKDPSLKSYHDLIRKVLAQRSLDFLVLEDINTATPELTNKEFFIKFLVSPESPFEGEVLNAVGEVGAIRLGDLLARLRPEPSAQIALIPAVWRLVSFKRLFVDFTHTPSRESLISVHPLNKPFYEFAR